MLKIISCLVTVKLCSHTSFLLGHNPMSFTSYLNRFHPTLPYKISVFTTLLLYMQPQTQCMKSDTATLRLWPSLGIKFLFTSVSNWTKCLANKGFTRQNLHLTWHCPLTSHCSEPYSMSLKGSSLRGGVQKAETSRDDKFSNRRVRSKNGLPGDCPPAKAVLKSYFV